jgi:hypothetical protein
MLYEIYGVAAVDAPDIPTGHHQAPSPETRHGQVLQAFVVCILVHVASLHVPPEVLHQYLLSPTYQHYYWEELWLCLDHALCWRPRQRD